ncbi:MAG TPA: hypothetical protein VFP05_17235 [Thermomicrobiales bacterium]|nr:hypothetical protein [Thermomicrobiales bacterium]
MRHLRIIVALLCTFVAVGVWVQPPFTGATQSPATPAGNGKPIADPWDDPSGTVRDLDLLSHTTDPVAGPLTATGELDANVPQFLSSGVHLQNAYARFSFTVPAAPSWTMGFTIGDDGQGNYLDISLLNESGTLSVNTGFVRDSQYFLVRSEPVTTSSNLDSTPGAVNMLSVAVYRGLIIVEGNDSEILEQIGFELSVPGDIRAKAGWDAGEGSPASPVSMTISDFSVWAVPRGGIVWGIAPGPDATPEPSPMQTPGSFITSAAGA